MHESVLSQITASQRLSQANQNLAFQNEESDDSESENDEIPNVSFFFVLF